MRLSLFALLFLVPFAFCAADEPKQAMDFYKRALECIESDKIDEALANLDDAIKYDPKFVKAYITRGKVQLR